MARTPIQTVRWKKAAKSSPDLIEPPYNSSDIISEIIETQFAAIADDQGKMFNKALATLRTGLISAVKRAVRSKKNRKSADEMSKAINLVVFIKFSVFRQRVKKYSLADNDLHIDLLESEIFERLVSTIGAWDD